jgi:hypothetical protein
MRLVPEFQHTPGSLFGEHCIRKGLAGMLRGVARLAHHFGREGIAMTFIVTHRYGAMRRETSLDVIDGLLAELDERQEDLEHPVVAVETVDGWCVSAHLDGSLTFENLENRRTIAPRYLRDVERSRKVEIMRAIALNQLSEVERFPWESE